MWEILPDLLDEQIVVSRKRTSANPLRIRPGPRPCQNQAFFSLDQPDIGLALLGILWLHRTRAGAPICFVRIKNIVSRSRREKLSFVSQSFFKLWNTSTSEKDLDKLFSCTSGALRITLA